MTHSIIRFAHLKTDEDGDHVIVYDDAGQPIGLAVTKGLMQELRDDPRFTEVRCKARVARDLHDEASGKMETALSLTTCQA